LNETPGETKWAGPELGEHNQQVFKEILNLSKDEYEEYVASGAIGK